VCKCDNLYVIALVVPWQMWRRRFSLPNLLKFGKCALLMEKETSRKGEQDLFSFERAARATV